MNPNYQNIAKSMHLCLVKKWNIHPLLIQPVTIQFIVSM